MSSHGIRLALSLDGDVVTLAAVDADSLFQRDAAELVGHRLDAILPGHADWLGRLIAQLADGEGRTLSLRMAAGTVDGVMRRRHGITSLALRPRADGPVADGPRTDGPRGNGPRAGGARDDGAAAAATARLAQPLAAASTTRRIAGLLARRIAEATGLRRVVVTRSDRSAIDEVIADHSLVPSRSTRARPGGPAADDRTGTFSRAARQKPVVGTTLASVIIVDGREWGRLLCHDDDRRPIPWALWEAIPRAVDDAARQIEQCLLRGESSGEIHHLVRRLGPPTQDAVQADVLSEQTAPAPARPTPYARLAMLLQGRILVAAEGRPQRAVAGGALRDAGFDVSFAPSAASAADMALAGSYDLILMDTEAHPADAIEAVQRLRAQPRTLYLPVIALTATDQRDQFADLLQAGIDDQIAKPLNTARLVAIASNWIDRYHDRQLAAGVAPTDAGQGPDPRSPLTAFLDGSSPLLERIVRDAAPLPAESPDAAATSAHSIDLLRELSRALDAARQVGCTDRLAELTVDLQRAWRPVAASIAAVVKNVVRTP